LPIPGKLSADLDIFKANLARQKSHLAVYDGKTGIISKSGIIAPLNGYRNIPVGVERTGQGTLADKQQTAVRHRIVGTLQR